jgi:hypothetical protein
MWPLEAKVLRSDGAIADYVRDVKEQFLTGRYAPYVNGGAMLGYMIRSSPVKAFDNIEKSLTCQLQLHSAFNNRHHRVSNHFRNLARADFISGPFQCHYLIMEMVQSKR